MHNARLNRLLVLLGWMVSAAAVAQVCNTAIPASTPTSSFIDHGDGTVTDQTTGLMWKRCAEGQSWSGSACAGTAGTMTWQSALQGAAAVTYAGRADWRLPNVKELRSIVQERCYNPSINATVFPNTPASVFWSGSPHANGSGYAWFVNFGGGGTNGYVKSNALAVRLVRAGQSLGSLSVNMLDALEFRVGNDVSTDRNILASGGSARSGATTDGESRLLLRANPNGPGTITFRLLDNVESGTLYDPGFNQIGGTITVPVQSTVYGYKAFAVYRPPEGFVRPGHPEDASASTRSTVLQVAFKPAGAPAPTQSVQQPIALWRPPVVLIHGLWASRSSWDTFKAGLVERLPGLQVKVADYSATNAGSLATNKLVPAGAVIAAKRQMRNAGIASVQADAFGHSMGGILSRIWAGDDQYKSPRNYGRGDFNKLTSLDSPHYGSPLADLVWLLWNDTESRRLLEALYGFSLDFTFGAFEDLQTSGSTALSTMNARATDAPAHAVVGNYVPTVDDLADLTCFVNAVVGEPALVIPCKVWKLLKFLGFSTGLSTHFPLGSDLVVGVGSQRDGFADGDSQVFSASMIHSCFSSYPCVLGEQAVIDHAVDLLNARPDSSLFRAGFPVTQMAQAVPGVKSAAAARAYSLAAPGTGVHISSPANGSAAAPGQVVTVLLTLDSGVALAEAMLVSPGDTQTISTPPWQFDLTIPVSATGNFPISVAARDTTGVIYVDNIALKIQQTTALVSLTATPASIEFDTIGAIQNITVSGLYADAVSRDVSNAAAGTVFASSNTVVATVDTNGIVRAIANGAADITASNGGQIAATSVTVAAATDLSVTQSAAPGNPSPGQQITYTLVVTNAGSQAALGIVLSDRLPDGAVFVSATGTGWTCNSVGQSAECQRDSLEAGSSSSVALVLNAPPAGGTFVNVVRVRAATPDDLVSNNVSMYVLGGTLTELGSSPNPSFFGQIVTFTTTVTGNVPTGSVQFKDGGSTIGSCTAQPLSAGVATCATANLAPGDHSVAATYSGDAQNPGSDSAILVQTVRVALDVDGNGQIDALTDGLLLIRHMFGLTESALVTGAIGQTAQRASAADIQDYLAGIGLLIDVDGNGQVDVATDGLLIIRYLFGLRGSALTDGAIGIGATRDGPQIEAYIQSLMP